MNGGDMSLIGSAAVLIVVIDLIATAAAQALPAGPWLRRMDRLGILPLWKFFAGSGIGRDWILLVRDGPGPLADEPWRIVGAAPRRWPRTFWNPDRHQQDQYAELMEAFARRFDREPDMAVDTSAAYRFLRDITLSLPRTGTAVATRQFAVDEAYGGQVVRRVFVSPPLPLA